jgi:hypothetical protein
MAITLKMPPLEIWQKVVYDDVHNARGSGNVYVVKSKRQVGKSCLAALLLIEYALKEKCISVVVEPTQAQSRRLFKQITDMMQKTGLVKSANSQLLTMEFSNGSEILFKSAEQRDALRGFTVSGLLVIDEAAFIPDPIFEILYPTCDANNAPILVISTPLFCSGEFYNLYTRGINGGKHTKSYNWSKYDTSKYLSKEKLEHYRETISSLKFKSEYLGEFISEGSYIFGNIGTCVYSSRKEGVKPIYAGIDWGAGNGGDYTAVMLMDSYGVITDIYAFNDLGPVEQIDKIASIIKSNPSVKTVCVEMNSIGSIYYDMLKRAIKPEIRKFNTTNDTKRNIIEQLITAFNTQKIGIPNDEELLLELQHYTVEKTTKGYTYNGADGVHDDYVMALALCYDTYKKKSGAGFQFGMA